MKTALGIVMYNPRYASTFVEKLLKSAIANAENNNGMNVGVIVYVGGVLRKPGTDHEENQTEKHRAELTESERE